MNHCSPNVAMHNLINRRCRGQSIYYSRDFGTELTAQSRLLSLVPDLRLSNVQFCCATYLNFVTQRVNRSRRALTSGQGD
jgi:hypothetical protein